MSTACAARPHRQERRPHRLGPAGRLERVVDAAAGALAHRRGGRVGVARPRDRLGGAELAAACARSRLTSTATTGSAPAAAAPITAERPTPPQPNTATRSPGATRAVRHAAHTPVVTAQPTSAATANGTSAAIGMHDASGTTVCSANVESSE